MKTLIHISLFTIVVSLFFGCEKSADSMGAPSNTGGAGGSTARFTIAGNYLYVVDHVSLKSFDITDPNAPVYKDKTDVGLNIETIFPYQDKLFIGSTSSMYIYSLMDPARPVRLAKADYTSVRMACDPIVVKDTMAYAALRAEITGPCGGGFGNSALLVYNIKNISAPVLIRQLDLQSPQGLGIKGNALYVCERARGLKIFNLDNPSSPIFVKSDTTDTFYDVIPYGNILICQVAGGFSLYDISDPLAPVFFSKILN